MTMNDSFWRQKGKDTDNKCVEMSVQQPLAFISLVTQVQFFSAFVINENLLKQCFRLCVFSLF